MKNLLFSSLATLLVIVNISDYTYSQDQTFQDNRDNKTYRAIKIGDQTWFAENLAYKSVGGCVAYDNVANIANKYGYLYDFETANKVCPSGWHLPTFGEFKSLIRFLGGKHFAFKKLKNENGFNVFPSGVFSNLLNKFYGINNLAVFWTGTTVDDSSYEFIIYFDKNDMSDMYGPMRLSGETSEKYMNSVRCIKD